MENIKIFFNVLLDIITLNLSDIDKERWEVFQAYGFFFLMFFMVVVLYAYWFHLYRAEKKGDKNYEKYAKLALDDELSDKVLEEKRSA
ncbi:cytochrome c oxidase, cbb3-type, CcoQ subunit [Campylobacter sp. MIT 99-7217]|uniref:cytochrome c oxidase, cbb3-type, CcoQ subunit n=1 Tax=Campylobacter sp. MIT 99-7217 TaxID=535091 RepID=UPI001156D476|nr:cytochrome c oxidase, cbb3-type, CcoQ subunit [Campylobacter sp. MIT 99-7217]TQR32481.1 cytochrome c oxidase, cbb3-type, CcoQ subunit [Campylobacter sp. MIT 99-7217]